MAPEEIILIEGEPGDGNDSHLTYADVEAWVAGTSSEVDRELIEGHLGLCDVCRGEAADLARVRDSLGTMPVHRRA